MPEKQLKQEIIEATNKFLEKWNSTSKIQISPISHKFNLKGRTAGQFCFPVNPANWHFRWNMELATKYKEDYLINTVGHEVAHLIVQHIKPSSKPHGLTWQGIMYFLGLEPSRCHNYKTTPAKTIERPWIHHCQCGSIHSFTNSMYKSMILKGLKDGGETYRYCNKCKRYINIVNVKLEK